MEMTRQLCPDCGAPLPAGASAGTCPNCLLRLAVLAGSADGPAPAPAASGQADSRAAASQGEQPGTRIGRYKLLEPIGEGGFGTVWMAEQQEPVRRKVALKIIKLGMDTREVIARFEAERQALALMDHPNIARVFDGGAAENGRPYFVMELVKGVRLTDYCDARRLDTRERLRLFIVVCQAVQHAHQKGIIHRDLKPSNVLVTEVDGHAVPKVIDFGIAKATEQSLTAQTLFTRFNQVIGSPAYMSPEQAGLGRLDIDTRSDIYSLGVLLYELLTGRPPFLAEELGRAGLDEILRTIREKEPPKPSTRLSTLASEDLATTAAQRALAPAKLSRLVRGELDWIVMKCLEKDRARRYETANGLARDIERQLNSEPVAAQPASAFYRFQKAVRRNRVAVTAATVVVIVLILGASVSTWQALRARRAEVTALAQQKIAEAARKASEEDLWKSRLAEARALRLGGELGRKEKALQAIAQAARLKSTPELVNEAISTLALFDLQPGTHWDRPSQNPVRLDHGFTRMATFESWTTNAEVDNVALWRSGSGEKLAEWKLGDAMHPLVFSPDDRYLLAPKGARGRPDVLLDLANPRPLRELPGTPFLAFSPDSQRYATLEGGGSEVAIRDLKSGAALRRLQPANGLKFSSPGTSHPSENFLAVAEGTAVSLWDWDSGKRRGTYYYNSAILAVACDGPWVAAGGFRTIRVWNRRTQRAVNIDAHSGRVRAIDFLAGGEILASDGMDGNLRLWHPVFGSLLLTTQAGHYLNIDPAGQRLGYSDSGGFGWWNLHRPIGRRELGPPYGAAWATFSPDGKLLATWVWGWLALYDAESGRLFPGPQSGEIGFTDLSLVQFLPDKPTLLTADRSGVSLWDYECRTNAGSLMLQWNAPRRPSLSPPPPYHRWQPEAIRDGTRVALRTAGDSCVLASLGSSQKSIRFAGRHPDSFALSPDGHWAATGTFFGKGPCVWDAATGQVVVDFDSDNSHCTFSPDGTVLLIAGSAYYRFLEVGTWRELRRIPTQGGTSLPNTAAWTADGRLLAIVQRYRQVRLLDGRTWEPLADLTSPNDFEIGSLTFSPTGRQLVVCHPAGVVEIWNLPELSQALAGLGLCLPLPRSSR